MSAVDVRACRVCGCTDDRACAGGCSWVDLDLCSQCVATLERAELLDGWSAEARINSERWFPQWHDGTLPMPLFIGYALGLAGEAGEVANAVKKIVRDGGNEDLHEHVADELADTFIYTLLLANEMGLDLEAAYRRKVAVNEERWQERQAGEERPATLRDAISEVMADAPTGGLSAPDVHDQIERRWPGSWPLITWLDVHDEMSAMFGSPRGSA